jgi:hypothetical protein
MSVCVRINLLSRSIVALLLRYRKTTNCLEHRGRGGGPHISYPMREFLNWMYRIREDKEDTQCAYNVILSRVALKSNNYYAFLCTRMRLLACMCVGISRRVVVCKCVLPCSLAYPSCNAHAPYSIVICGPLSFHHIFRHYLINGMITGKKNFFNIKYIFIFSTTFI